MEWQIMFKLLGEKNWRIAARNGDIWRKLPRKYMHMDCGKP